MGLPSGGQGVQEMETKEMSIKPILFNTNMVRALQNGTKTVTRRVVKAQHLRVLDSPYRKQHPETPDKVLLERLCASPYRPGDILYVRETWAEWWLGGYIYKADNPDRKFDVGNWAPSIHMPRKAARIFLRVTDVRVERLQNITVEGVLCEGVPDIEPPPICKKEPSYPESFPKGFDKWSAEKREDWIQSEARARYIGWCEYADKLRRQFGIVWDSTIKPADRALYGWAANPWVWVIEFERCGKPKEDAP